MGALDTSGRLMGGGDPLFVFFARDEKVFSGLRIVM